MIKQAVQDALNDQIKHELYSAYVYLSVSAYCDSIGLQGFAHWMRMQNAEEQEHALKIFDFINDRGGRVRLQAIDQPASDFGTPLQIAEKALEHERKVTGLIERLYELAVKEGDYATQVLMQWFITEQVEEEKNASILVEQLKMIGDNRTALLMLDMELGKRQAGA
ncbi:MAG TPA: ferritin [Chloroflexia bacterium]|nr:ferritin [Chloroflexia bacterium]